MEKNLFFNGANSIRCIRVGKIKNGQDGIIHGGRIFRFNGRGQCWVCSARDFSILDEFTLDKGELIVPHSNSVCLGSEYADVRDPMPVLYSNVYNNYAKQENRHEGECCVYRITEDGGRFGSELKQIIQIGFVQDPLWRSADCEDVRPYGNFAVDSRNNFLYVFTMLDGEHITRIFKFRLPMLTDGVKSSDFSGTIVTLGKEDILECFDVPYSHYIQGAVFYDGYIYSVEGFTNSEENPPNLKVFDVEKQKCVLSFDLPQIGLNREPEFLEVQDGKLYYSDNPGNYYLVVFESVDPL